ncbi:MAG: aminopeptidase P family protein [Eubacteriales bacterium]
MNLEKLISALPANIDGILIDSAENRRYFTGFPSSAGLLIATKKGSVFITDSRYIEAAKNKIDCCEVLEQKKPDIQLPEIAAKLSCKSLAIEARRTTLASARKFEKYLRDVVIVDDDTADKLIDEIRIEKNAEEIDRIKKAQLIAEKAFDYILNYIKTGITERDIALELDYFMLKNGAEALSFETIVASGVDSAMPHAVPSNKVIAHGDFITMDFGAVIDGYHSDMTRTIAVGKVSEKQKLVYNTVLTAQLASLKILAPGLTCKVADLAAREVINNAGFGSNFGHGTGHGVGIEIHEEPALSPSGEKTLEAGHVVTVEPGIYLPGEFGVRIEDMAVITINGCENLTHSPKELIVVSG